MADAIPPGARAPEVDLPDLDGRSRRPLAPEGASRPGGAAVLLVFFKDDCPTSRFTLPFVQRIHEALAASGGRGAAVYGISQDDAGTSRAAADSLGLTFPILIDGPGCPVSSRYGLTAVPTSVLVGGDGKVLRAFVGFSRKEIEACAREMAEAAGAPPPKVFAEGEKVPETRPG
jgi:peroxiredoxin